VYILQDFNSRQAWSDFLNPPVRFINSKVLMMDDAFAQYLVFLNSLVHFSLPLKAFLSSVQYIVLSSHREIAKIIPKAPGEAWQRLRDEMMGGVRCASAGAERRLAGAHRPVFS
jgi:hypothetical protein